MHIFHDVIDDIVECDESNVEGNVNWCVITVEKYPAEVTSESFGFTI